MPPHCKVSEHPAAMLRVMSFNIRYRLAPDGPNCWEARKPLVIERVRAFDPHLLALQECRDDEQAAYVRESLPEWDFYGVPRGGGDQTALEMAPVLFKRSEFERVDAGCFWLSRTPAVPGSKSWGAAFARTVTWVRLLHLPSRRELTFLSTHFDLHPPAITGAARLLQGWAQAAAQAGPVILCGDFNAPKDSPAYRQMTGDGPLRDVYRQLHPASQAEATFHGYGDPAALASIDWILASAHFQVLSAAVDATLPGGRYPSDHYPLNAVLGLQPVEQTQ